jgi:hypothetical protein
MRARRWQIVLVVVVVAGGLAVAGSWARRTFGARCALDGVRLEPRYRVRVEDDRGQSRDFCCVRCAELWLGERHERPRAVWVTDEVSGREVEAGDAWFVRSTVVTTPTSGNRVHAFREREDAEKHAAAEQGRILTGPDRPFAGE